MLIEVKYFQQVEKIPKDNENIINYHKLNSYDNPNIIYKNILDHC